jgi:hypothetical protein
VPVGSGRSAPGFGAWAASLISGAAAAGAMVFAAFNTLASSSTPDPLPAAFMVLSTVAVALMVGAVVVLAVRYGLHLASCRLLPARSTFVMAAVIVLILGVAATWPIETHVVVIDMPTSRSSSAGLPLAFWLPVVGVLLVPTLVSYVFGRLARDTPVKH